ncbi:sodium/calcium exchanger 1a isoform X1 [Takifugu flavidus]|uniref:sodium/calcium exchanger 1a isoform X1 n=2 Tax=Takifugu flavidus TaxID=433684 RepID=UPI0025446F93|nr:sodium/calcium exchanger 1a isoform X1 [Takifugu flavidus]XP_056891885.1 sodium/calcium exchanger 1a isoform X1 [Takifugu flavidus]XP_056891886.1 sodium/calcium exchanger 1a isoform X1 [Takifugu flavidus]
MGNVSDARVSRSLGVAMRQVGWQFSSYQLVLLLSFISIDLPLAAGGGSNNTLKNSTVCEGRTNCIEGVILPIWKPENPTFTERLSRATVYFVALVYMFLGVSIIADRFMASIEVITSQERKITIKKPNGEKITTTVRIWNETVSNLTLMALGSSAPEILLSVVEVCGHNFDAGELGPNTIVGSAAFNMFVIIGLCVSIIPEGQTRKVKHLRVFFVTAIWSIFAYTWLYMILAVTTPGVVEIWEGLLTLFFFPLCVGFAYVADQRLLFYKYVYKRYRAGKRKGVIIEMEGEPELTMHVDLNSHGEDLGHECKGLDDLLTDRLTDQVLKQQQAGGPLHQCQIKNHVRATNYDICSEVSNSPSSEVFFHPGFYQCVENCGSVALNVVRRGGDLRTSVLVNYQTEDGTARSDSDYQFTEGALLFQPGETQKVISINIVDDDIFEEDEHFLVHLSNVTVLSEGNAKVSCATLSHPCTAKITILDDDHAGIFTFEEETVTVSKSIGVLEVKVLRKSGACGVVVVPYSTAQGTAKGGGENFEDTHGVLEFDNGEICKTIQVNIIDDEEYEKNKNFFIELGDPRLLEMSERKARLLQEVGKFVQTGRDMYRKVQEWHPSAAMINIPGDKDEMLLTNQEKEEQRIAVMGRPILGEHVKLEVTIEESYEFKSTVDKLLKKTNLALVVGTNSWREQFVEAITITSDTFASKVSAVQDQYADASIGNVTGSNAVNVFLGIGVAWSIAAIYHYFQGEEFKVDPGTLAFSVTLFTIFAFICIAVLIYRRRPEIGGELGGPKVPKMLTTGLFFSLWLMYIFFSSLEAYCHIQAF